MEEFILHGNLVCQNEIKIEILKLNWKWYCILRSIFHFYFSRRFSNVLFLVFVVIKLIHTQMNATDRIVITYRKHIQFYKQFIVLIRFLSTNDSHFCFVWFRNKISFGMFVVWHIGIIKIYRFSYENRHWHWNCWKEIEREIERKIFRLNIYIKFFGKERKLVFHTNIHIYIYSVFYWVFII